jgi:tRNA-dihydrouridine synthase B
MANLCIGPIALSSPLALAPMAGYTDLPFRIGVRRIGGLGLTCTEMISPRKVIEGNVETDALLTADPVDRPCAVQLYGAEEQYLVDAARRVIERGAEIIDINLGCPVRKITRKGGGAALLAEPERAARLVERIIAAAGQVPMTAKLRLGPSRGRETAPELARLLAGAGVAALFVHGRFADEGYGAPADMAAVRRVVDAAGASIMVFANGDIDSAEAAVEAFKESGAAGLAVGRAALRDPWVFKEIAAAMKGEAFKAPSREERARFAMEHFKGIIALRGEKMACRQMRKWAEYYGPALGLCAAAKRRFARMAEPEELEGILAD